MRTQENLPQAFPSSRLPAKFSGHTKALRGLRVLLIMPAMSARILGTFAIGLMTACAPSMEADHVKTPDELIAEEEQKGAEQLQNEKNADDYDTTSAGETDEDKRRGWDAKQSGIEMHRAANSAETCIGTVTEKVQKGKASVTVTFSNDGHVKAATIAEPYSEETNVGKCVMRAMKAVIVPSYQGEEKTLSWEIDLTGGKKSGPVGGEAEEAKDEGKKDK